jgi:hypothetical protein
MNGINVPVHLLLRQSKIIARCKFPALTKRSDGEKKDDEEGKS